MEISAERYVDLIVKFLEEVRYGEPVTPRAERAKSLCHVFHETRGHFRQSHVADALFDDQELTSIVRTITRMTVFGWENLPMDVMVPLNIYFTYVILEDDPGGDSFNEQSGRMGSFVSDLLLGKEQSHPTLESLFAFFPQLLRHYGKFSQLTMLKSTLELIQGFWIERLRFLGLPGSSDYPMFLRRLNGLGDFSGASLFPLANLDEDTYFEDVVTVIAQIEPVVTLVNDLFSFYKETNADDINLARSISMTENLGAERAITRIADDGARAVTTLVRVIESRQSAVTLKTVNDFVRGYIRWHLCDERYRMEELSDQCASGNVSAEKFRRFQELACHAGCVDLVDFRIL